MTPTTTNPERRSTLIALKKELADADLDFDGSDPAGIIRWAVEAIGSERLVVATAFGPSGMVNLHLISEIAPEVPVVFIDTLYHFDETLDLARRAVERYAIDLRVYRPAESREEFEREHGEHLWEHDLTKFHELTKIKPMERALEDVGGWITGRRRDQSPTRTEMPYVEIGDRIKVNPLAAWTRKDVWTFIHRNDVPYNALHDRGYSSVGDAPLTTPVLDGEHERAGRWRGQDRLECGLHTLI
jgi:phosphoadenosine phosphosulfate reductase